METAVHSLSYLRFQFTHPGRGATEGQCLHSHHACSFNSRTPGGVRRPSARHQWDAASFQFTHPGRGATQARASYHSPAPRFNSRTPGGVRHNDARIEDVVVEVSIHAPREGCDKVCICLFGDNVEFQFTHPGRGATTHTYSLALPSRFQFTHPGRGATVHRVR